MTVRKLTLAAGALVCLCVGCDTGKARRYGAGPHPGGGDGAGPRTADKVGGGPELEPPREAGKEGAAETQRERPADAWVRVDGFEDGLAGWSSLWTRDAGMGRLSHDAQVAHGGGRSARIEHSGGRDWALGFVERKKVRPGDLFEITAWVKVEGEGSATLCATLRDAGGEVRDGSDWVFAGRTLAGGRRGERAWRRLRSRFAVPRGVAEVEARLIGHGPATAWLDDFRFERKGNVMDMRGADMPERLTLENRHVSVTFEARAGTISILDKRTRATWRGLSASERLVVRSAAVSEGRLALTLLDAASGLDLKATVALEPDAAEYVVSVREIAPGQAGDGEKGEFQTPLAFPAPFAPEAGTYLVVPMNEGVSYPVEDEAVEPMRLIAYGGHGICMAFWGATDGERGHMAIIETPDDAALRLDRADGKLVAGVEWRPQKGRFGYPRRVRYAFFDKGGHVAVAKRYRRYVKSIGLLKTLAEKALENPNVDLLAGAVNVWCWEKDALVIVKEMRAAGIERILWSHRLDADSIRAMNAMGVLTSRYDIYQDVMDPARFPLLRGVHPDWPTEAWPHDLMRGAAGERVRGWQVTAKDGKRYPCGVLCDARAPGYARKRIAEELRTRPYRCRFIDTTTATPWRECYDPAHPMTRSESRRAKMELLAVVSGESKLVTGCETGHDAAVPYVHYFEGMLSLGPYRIPEAGRDMTRIWDEVPERVRKFQVGHEYRLPLWELVYHDCVVAQWYWGDYNNKLPAIWRKRDLFNTLYATPPMFMFKRAFWSENKERFAGSYARIAPVARACAYSEMTDHRFLTPDRSVQQTRFANGVTVTVNFGEAPHRLPGGQEVAPMGFHVEGLR